MSALGLALGLPFSRPSGGAVPAAAVLEGMADDPYVAYSIYRFLVPAYASGPLMRVRADRTGQPELDIGYVAATGLLDTAALLTFAGADSCYVTTVYDQSSSMINMVQATAGSQPRIVNAGALEVNDLNIPAQVMSSQTLRAETALAYPFTLYANLSGVIDGDFRIIFGLEGIARHIGKLNTSTYYANGGIVSSLAVTGNNQLLAYTYASNPSEDVMRVDGVDSGVADGAGSTGFTYPIRWGNTGDLSAPWSGKSTELVVYSGTGQGEDYSTYEAALTLS